jgi:hypothetical protein
MRQDILLKSNGGFRIINGDFVLGESNEQHVELILETNPNEWKASPITGAGLVKTLGGNITGFAKRNVQVQLEADGYSLDKITENENGINVTANTI